jgi:hypothetical protein
MTMADPMEEILSGREELDTDALKALCPASGRARSALGNGSSRGASRGVALSP